MLWKVIFGIYWKYNVNNPGQAFLNLIFLATMIVNYYFLPKYYGYLFELFNKNINTFMYAFMYIIIINAIIYFINKFNEYYASIQSIKIKQATYYLLIDKIKKLYINNPHDIVIGEKLAGISEFQSTIGLWYDYLFSYIIPYILTICIFSYHLLKYDYLMPLLLLGFTITLGFLIYFNYSYNTSQSTQATGSYLKKYQELEDYLSNLSTIHTYNQFKNEEDKIDELSNNYQQSAKINDKYSLKWSLLGTIMTGIFFLLIMFRCYNLMNKGKMTKGEFLSTYFIGIEVLDTLNYFNDTLHQIFRDYKALKKIEMQSGINLSEDDLDIDKELKLNVKTPRIETDSLISLRNITYKYPSTIKPIIEGLNLDIKEGEKIALIGDIGAGKSTLLKIILGLLKPNDGDLYMKGHNYKMKASDDLFKKFGYMTQNPVLFNRSIIENIRFGKPETTREEVISLLEKFKLNDVFSKLKKGIDSSVGKNGSKLSGGQKQVIWFLRIYLHNPDILLLDEPTASLSKESKETLWNLIKEVFKDKTIIMSTHDDFLIKLATRKVKL
jgi:ATP-binding cassette subfamily C protein